MAKGQSLSSKGNVTFWSGHFEYFGGKDGSDDFSSKFRDSSFEPVCWNFCMSVSTFLDFSSLTFAIAVGVQRSLWISLSLTRLQVTIVLPIFVCWKQFWPLQEIHSREQVWAYFAQILGLIEVYSFIRKLDRKLMTAVFQWKVNIN